MATSFRYYLLIDGVIDDTRDPAHPGWIPILSFQWGLSGTPQRGIFNTQEPNFVAPLGKSSAVLRNAAANGALFATAKLNGALPKGGSRRLISFTEIMVSSFQWSNDTMAFTLTAARYELAAGWTKSSLQSQ